MGKGNDNPPPPQTQVITPSQSQALTPTQMQIDSTLGAQIAQGLSQVQTPVNAAAGSPQSSTATRGNFPRFDPQAYQQFRQQRQQIPQFGGYPMPGQGGPPQGQPAGPGQPLTGPGGQFGQPPPAYGGAPPTGGGGQQMPTPPTPPPQQTASPDNPFNMPVVTSYQDPRYQAWQDGNDRNRLAAFQQGGFSGGATWNPAPMPFQFEPDQTTHPAYGFDPSTMRGV